MLRRFRRFAFLFPAALGLAAAAPMGACSPANEKGVTGTKDSGVGDTATTTEDTGLVNPEDSGIVLPETAPNPDATSGCTDDNDCDGYKAGVDCDDNDKTVNPEAYDFPGDDLDNDCNGTKDDPVTDCAATVATATDPVNYARALDLCPQKSITKTGKPFDPVVSGTWGQITGTLPPTTIKTNVLKQTKILPQFGDNLARKGANLIALSTGTVGATDPRNPTNGAINANYVQDPCTAIPIVAADCKSLTSGTSGGSSLTLTANDYAELKLSVKVPSNANAMLLDFSFFSTEFNEFWKSNYNDGFFVLVTSQKLKGINVAKDAKGLGITVNSGYFQLCPKSPGPAGLDTGKLGGLANCVGEPTDPTGAIFGSLKGTGFAGDLLTPASTDDTTAGVSDSTKKYVYGGASGWLTSKFGVTPGESLIIRFIIFDTGDGILDSAVLLDNIRWEKAPPATVDPVVERPPA
jgi:hypothetical protein